MARKPGRKLITMQVQVSVPATMQKARAVLEVRTLINEQANYFAEPGDVRVRTCRAIRAASPVDKITRV